MTQNGQKIANTSNFVAAAYVTKILEVEEPKQKAPKEKATKQTIMDDDDFD